MADDSITLLETLRKMSIEGDVDMLREGVRLLAVASRICWKSSDG